MWRLLSGAFPASLVASQELGPVGAGRAAGQATEHGGEVARGPEAHQSRDLGDGELAGRQERDGAVDARADHEAMRREPGAVLEEPGEVVRTHVHPRAELGEPQVLVEMLLDVVRDPPQASQGKHAQLGARGLGPTEGIGYVDRRGRRLHLYRPPHVAWSRVRLTASSRASPWNGFPRNATAPAARERRRTSSSPWAVRMIAGMRAPVAARCVSRSSPLIPPIRRSTTRQAVWLR